MSATCHDNIDQRRITYNNQQQQQLNKNFSTTDFYSSTVTAATAASSCCCPQVSLFNNNMYTIHQQQQQIEEEPTYITKFTTPSSSTTANCVKSSSNNNKINNNNNLYSTTNTTTNCNPSTSTMMMMNNNQQSLSTNSIKSNNNNSMTHYNTTVTTTTTTATATANNTHYNTMNHQINKYAAPTTTTYNTNSTIYNNVLFVDNRKQTVQNHTFDTPPSKYKVTDIIGSGTYGVVAICKDQQQSNQQEQKQYALKKNIRVFPDENDLLQSNNSTGNSSSAANGSSSGGGGKYTAFNNSGKLHQLRMLRELKMLHHFRNCPYIVSLKDVYVPNQLNELRDIEMITSLMEADLRDIFDSGQVLSPKHVKWFMYQICLSVYYMQQAKILHRDLKPENILVNSQCDVAICDFGLARGYYNSNNIHHYNNTNNTHYNNNNNTHYNNNTNHYNNNHTSDNEEFNDNTRLSSNYVVSRWYRPPELLTNATHVYNKTLDVWSVGCIMYELLSGKGEVLFKGSGSIDQIQRIIKQLGTPSFDDFNGSDAARDYIYNKFPICKRRSFTKRLPPNTCPMAIDLMKRMLTFNMYKRITPIDALLHPYFREFYDQSDLNIPMIPFDTAWESKMLSSNDLKLEAYNTLQSIKRDHQREFLLAQLEQSQQLYEQVEEEEEEIVVNDDNEEQYQELLLIEDDNNNDEMIMLPSTSSSSADVHMAMNGGCNNISSDDLLLASCTSDSVNNQQDDFLMMVVDSYSKFSVDTQNGSSSEPVRANKYSNQQQHHLHSTSSSSKQNNHHFSPSTVEMNISYHTTRV